MHSSTVEQIAALGSELNANQYRIVRLAAQYDTELEWHRRGFANPAMAIAQMLDIHTGTAREWIRVGHALGDLPGIDEAFRSNRLSYAKARILTRWALPENEQELLGLARDRSANRLTVAVARFLAGSETEAERDQRHHDCRSVTVSTDAEGMVIIRACLPPGVGKHVAEAINTLVQQIAATPVDGPDASADAYQPLPVVTSATSSGQGASADASSSSEMGERLRELKRQWQPADSDDFDIPSLAQQRADAFALLFLGSGVEMTTEVVIHVRGDGTTFDDGTPATNNAVCQRLDESFVRLMIHDAERRPINASNRRRFATARQKRVVLESHNHECIDCQATDLLELDHNPPYHETGHTVTSELEPRCAPCHRARHRGDRALAA